MAGTNLSFPYDEELFNYSWKTTPDLILTNMLTSGAVVQDSEIQNLISTGSNFFTTPYYDVLSGVEDNYNGVDSFTGASLAGGAYSGCVYGRMSAWNVKSFIKDFNSGADPMSQIVSGVANYWNKIRQERLINIVGAVFGITGNADWDLHKTDIGNVGYAQSEKFTVTAGASSSANATVTITSNSVAGSPKAVTVALASGDTAAQVATKIVSALNGDPAVSANFTATASTADVIITRKSIAPFDSTLAMAFGAGTTGATAGASVDNTSTATTVGDANKVGVTTFSDAMVKACGDNAGIFSLAIMHSVVASRLANLQLLEYSKYTDPAGITRNLPIATINGITVIINDNVPVTQSPIEGQKEYTSYIFGAGAIRYASAPVDKPSEMDRDPNTNGGVDKIFTRLREVIHPYGFSFKGDVTTDVSVPNAVLYASASYELKMPAKSIAMARIITNG